MQELCLRKQKNSQIADYGSYHLSIKEELGCIGVAIFFSSVAAWILYKSLWGLFLVLVFLPLCRNYYRKQQIEKQKKELLLQFKDAMQCVSVALLSGYSLENAWIEAERELRNLYGSDANMTRELRQMNIGIKMNQPIEQLLHQFALRSFCEDIVGFSEVFRFAKRSGGNFNKIIQNTILRISEKIQVEREIETEISGKKMEQKIMNIVPVCLLGYLNLTSGEFLAPLYGNVFGVCVMSFAFVAYLGALVLANKMSDIKV